MRPAPILFLSRALETVDEMRDACKEIDKPMVANMATGGEDADPEFQNNCRSWVYAMAIFPALGSLVAAAALEKSLSSPE